MSLLDTASLIVTPNGYKEGKLYSVIPSDGSGDMSVVRATTATRVNSAGLVELVPYNLFQYSQDFSNAVYNKLDIQTVTTGITDPNGGTTGVRLIPYVGFNGVVTQTFSTAIGSTYTLTFWMKGNANGVLNVNYNGAVLSPQNNVSYTTQWQQFQYVFTADSNSSEILFGGFFTWASGQQIDFTFAQVNEGSTAKPYQKTETRLNIPRLDYSNGTCPSLLVEPQRTNLLTYSSSFDNSDWTKSNVTISANSVVSPSGIQDADTLTASGGSALHTTFLATSLFGANHTISVYAKKNTNDFLQIYTDFVNTDYANFDLANGTTGSVGLTVISSSIESVGNGWYRCSFVTGSILSRYVNFSIISSASAPRAETNSLTTSVYIWGAQLEAGSYPTSYIPTTSASVTRNVDVISKTGISSLFGTNQGTFFCDFIAPSTDLSIAQYIFDVSDGTNYNVNRLAFYKISTNVFQLYTNTGTNITINANTRNKVAIVWNGTNVKVFANGSQQASITYANTNPSKINLGSRFNNIEFGNVFFNASASWSTALSDTQLATLTTL